MKNIYLLFVLLYCMLLQVKANKIEKKIIVGRSIDCKGLAFNCKSTQAKTIQVIYTCNESHSGSLIMQFPVEAVQQNSVLSEAFSNKREVNIEEDWLLPSDVSNELKLPEGYSIKKGTFMIENRNDTYNIILIP